MKPLTIQKRKHYKRTKTIKIYKSLKNYHASENPNLREKKKRHGADTRKTNHMEQKADHRGGGKGRRQRGGQIKSKSIGIVKRSFGAEG